MSTLNEDTAVERVEPGHYKAELSERWAMWVPVGGYLAAIALRAAGDHTDLPRPASLSCHYLRPAGFGPAELEVSTLSDLGDAQSLSVTMTQDDEVVLQALVWAAAQDLEGPKGTWTPAPEAPAPDDLEELELDEDSTDRFGDEPFWKNLDIRPIRLGHGPPPEEEHDGVSQRLVAKRASRLRGWDRFLPAGSLFKDPWLDACRPLIIIDISQYPAVAMPYTPPIPFLAPTLDLTVHFHGFAPEEEWLMADAQGSAAGDGLLSAKAQVWSQRGLLLATGYSNMLHRPVGLPADDTAWFGAHA